ncbi:MAG: ABC transporter ATP-binding protein [Methylococcus sp.]
MVAIHIRHLSKRFGDTPVLDRIDLCIEPGEMFFLLGPSGCGKTTLLRHIAGFYTPDAGTIGFGETDVTRTPPHERGTAMMFQSYALWPHLTVAENVAFGLEERRLPRAEIAQRVHDALDAVRLAALGDRRIQQLSGGQQQRVALARALVVRPHCLLLDEPLSNLDTQLRREMRAEIRRICKDFGLTAVYVTHDQEEALSMADRLAVMQAGRLAQVGSPREVYRRPVSRLVAGFIGETHFLPARVLGCDPASGTARVESMAGKLTARLGPTDWLPETGASVWLSIRPEGLRLSPSDEAVNAFPGELVDIVYLGATARYRLRLAGGAELTLTELNPSAEPRAAGERIVAHAAIDDLVLLPE